MPETEENSLTAFGANTWLVDEMREKFDQDPNSVDKVWWDFFTSGEDGTHSPGNGTSKQAAPAKAEQPSKDAKKSEPKAAAAPESKPAQKPTQKQAQKQAQKAEPKATPKPQQK